MVVFKLAAPLIPHGPVTRLLGAREPSDAAVEIRWLSLIWWITIIEYNLKARRFWWALEYSAMANTER